VRTTAKLADILATLESGGVLRFDWIRCDTTLIDAKGHITPIDGRAYHAFVCKGHSEKFECTKIGSTDENNLIMEYRKAKP